MMRHNPQCSRSSLAAYGGTQLIVVLVAQEIRRRGCRGLQARISACSIAKSALNRCPFAVTDGERAQCVCGSFASRSHRLGSPTVAPWTNFISHLLDVIDEHVRVVVRHLAEAFLISPLELRGAVSVA
jgi:hypothetical protein